MQYYLFPTIAFFAFIIENSNIRGIQSRYFILLIFLIIGVSLFVSLRGEGIGTDYYAYQSLFNDPFDVKIEPGFSYLTLLVRSFGGGFQFFLALFFISSLLLKVFVFNEMSYSIPISLMVSFGFWFLVYDMNGIRQGLSIAIIGVAAYNAYLKKFKYFLLFTILASLFHATSLFFLPFYFLLNLDIKKKHVLIILILLFILSLFGFSDFVFSKILGISFDNYFIDKVSAYSDIEDYNSNILLSFNFIHRLLIFAITFFLVDYIPAEKRLKSFFLIAAFMNISIFMLFSRFELIATRGSLSYRFIECIFFSYLPFVFKENYMKFIVGSLLYLYVIFQIYVTIIIPDGNLFPYKSILF